MSIKSLILLITLVSIFSTMTNVYALDLSATIRQDVYSNEDIDSGNSLILKLGIGEELYKTKFFLLGGMAQSQMRKGCQHFMDLRDYQLGVGLSRELVKGLSIYGQVAYHYMGDSEMDSSYHEAVNYYWRDRLPGETKPNWGRLGGDGNDIEYTEVSDYIGGEVGIEFTHKFGKTFEIGINAAYRIGEPDIYTKYYNNEVINLHNVWWELEEGLDMGGPSVGATFKLNF